MYPIDKDPTKTIPPPALLNAALELWQLTGKWSLITITGQSMLPLIQEGDQLLVAHASSPLKRGDVILYKRAGRLVAHRLLYVDGDQAEPIFITKGDNAFRLDLPVRREQVVGRVLQIQRGSAVISLDTPPGRTVGWLIAVGMVVWVNLYRLSLVVKTKLWGTQSNRVSVWAGQSLRSIPAFLLNCIKITTRW